MSCKIDIKCEGSDGSYVVTGQVTYYSRGHEAEVRVEGLEGNENCDIPLYGFLHNSHCLQNAFIETAYNGLFVIKISGIGRRGRLLTFRVLGNSDQAEHTLTLDGGKYKIQRGAGFWANLRGFLDWFDH